MYYYEFKEISGDPTREKYLTLVHLQYDRQTGMLG